MPGALGLRMPDRGSIYIEVDLTEQSAPDNLFVSGLMGCLGVIVIGYNPRTFAPQTALLIHDKDSVLGYVRSRKLIQSFAMRFSIPISSPASAPMAVPPMPTAPQTLPRRPQVTHQYFIKIFYGTGTKEELRLQDMSSEQRAFSALAQQNLELFASFLNGPGSTLQLPVENRGFVSGNPSIFAETGTVACRIPPWRISADAAIIKASLSGMSPEYVDSPHPLQPEYPFRVLDSRSTQWTADKDASNCQICGRDFTLFFRRHHCRHCGRCICNACIFQPQSTGKIYCAPCVRELPSF